MRNTLLQALIAVVLVGCAREHEPDETAAHAAERKEAPRASAASDMCAEHGVLEALCTKCHPALTAVFKAKGDWCEEHGFPESICPTCHPERGGRPAVAIETKDDGAPADGLPVNLKSPDIEKHAGIQTAKAVVSENAPGVDAVARIVYDAAKVARVNARAAGVVRDLRVDVGSKVKKGEALAVIESASVGADRSALMAAQARVKGAEAEAQRQRELAGLGISAAKNVQASEQELAAARAEVSAAQAALGVVGASADGTGGYVLAAPLQGVVVKRDVAVGQTVDTAAVLFEVVDASAMWAEIDVAEADLAHVAVGQEAVLSLDALPDHALSGTIDYIAPEVDAKTRTAKARIALKNVDGKLRANMYGRARISIGAGRQSVVVPREALQTAKGVHVVFVRNGAGKFETRRVKLGLDLDDRVEIKDGLKAGEEVVTTGSFLLKTETLKDSIGAGCCD